MRRFGGQSSVEYAIVFAAFLAMVVGLGGCSESARIRFGA